MEKTFEGGAILDNNTISNNDFLLGGDGDLSTQLSNFEADEVKFYYNQAKQSRTRNGCTNYASIGCISDLMGFRFSNKEILEIHDLAEKDYGRKEDNGNYLYKAVDCLRNWWNNKNTEDNHIITFRVDLLSSEAQKLLDGGKSIMIGYRTSSEHYRDSQDNGNMDLETFKGIDKTGGHAIRINREIQIDNYDGVKKYNSYTNKKLKDYVKEGTYFRYGYVFFKKEKSIFKDLAKNHPFYKKVKFLYDNKIIKGYDDKTVRLENNITRGEVFVLLADVWKALIELSKKVDE